MFSQLHHSASPQVPQSACKARSLSSPVVYIYKLFRIAQTSQATRLLNSEFNKYANQDPVDSIGIRHLFLVLDILEDGLI